MKRIFPTLIALALVAPAAWCQQQWYDGKVYSERTTHRFRVEPAGYATIEWTGVGYRGLFVVNDPWYGFNSIAVWPEGGVWRVEWWHWQFLSWGKATGWATIRATQGGMEWVLDLTSDYFGFVERFFVRFVAR